LNPAIEALPPPHPSGDTYEVYAMRYASIPERMASNNFMRGALDDPHEGPMPLDFYVWIIRNQDRVVLVDTGFDHRAAAKRGRPIDFAPHDGLALIGIAADSIRDIILTHLHFDHAGGIDHYPNARFHVQDAEVAYATGRCMCHPIGRFFYDVEDVVSLVRNTYADRVSFYDGDAEIFPGISVHLLPGHSRGMQGVRVNTKRGPILLASDGSHYYDNFTLNAPFAVTVDVAATLNTYRRMFELVEGPKWIIPGHDPKVRRLYAGITVQGVELNALHLPSVC